MINGNLMQCLICVSNVKVPSSIIGTTYAMKTHKILVSFQLQNHSHLTAGLFAKLDDLFLRPSFHGQIFFDKEGLSQKNMLLLTQFCGEVSLSNICDKGERAK